MLFEKKLLGKIYGCHDWGKGYTEKKLFSMGDGRGGNIAREFVFLYNAQVLLNSYIKILFKQF